jgi:hypothetical protein
MAATVALPPANPAESQAWSVDAGRLRRGQIIDHFSGNVPYSVCILGMETMNENRCP